MLDNMNDIVLAMPHDESCAPRDRSTGSKRPKSLIQGLHCDATFIVPGKPGVPGTGKAATSTAGMSTDTRSCELNERIGTVR
jgi:hypothetical protein